jgi:hypothetical protein
MIHSFNTEIAAIYGIEEAVILNNLTFWIEKNAANGVNFNDGRYWTYNSVNAFGELFPYLSKKRIYRALVNLENDGAIISGNYNEKAYDRTKWYALSDKYLSESLDSIDFPKMENGTSKNGKCISQNEQMEFPVEENALSQTGQPIPDSKPDNKPNKIPPCPHKEIVELYNKILPELQSAIYSLWDGSGRQRDLSARWKQSKEHQSLEFWEWYFNSVRSSDWHMGNNGNNWRADIAWLLKRGNFEKMVERAVS